MGYIIKNITKNKLSVGIGGRPITLASQETLIIKGNSYPVSLRKLEVKRLVEVNYVSDDVIGMYYTDKGQKKELPKKEVVDPPIVEKVKEEVILPTSIYSEKVVAVEEVIEEPVLEELADSDDEEISNSETKKSSKKKTDK